MKGGKKRLRIYLQRKKLKLWGYNSPKPEKFKL